jgi:hypothetical protein
VLLVHNDEGFVGGGAPGGDLLRQAAAEHLHPEHQRPVGFHELEDAGVPDPQPVVGGEVPPRRVQPPALEVAAVARRPRPAAAEEHGRRARLREVPLEARRDGLSEQSRAAAVDLVSEQQRSFLFFNFRERMNE